MKINFPERLFGFDTHLLPIVLPAFGVILAALAVTNLVLMPKISGIGEINAKTVLIKQETKKITDKIDYISSLNPEELNKNSGLINSALLPEKNSYMLVNIIRKIADKYGFQVDGFKISISEITAESTVNTKKVDGVSKIPVNLQLTGPKSGYLNLVNGLEKSLPVMSVDRFGMKSVGDLVTMDLLVSAFYIENKSVSALEKLSLGDLVLKKEESDLIKKIADYSLVVQMTEMEGQLGRDKEFKTYQRSDPFN